jgi:putative hemolysin
MSEIAVVSSRRARLQGLADSGRPGAQAALELNTDPSRFLSTIQVGITSVGILSGALGEGALADPLTDWLSSIPWLAHYSRGIALAIVVVGITYLSVVVGELVPKRLALLAPETLASIVSRPMAWLARAARPLVMILSSSSDVLLRLLSPRRRAQPPVTDEEIKVLMEQGAEAGIFHESEQEIVSNVLRLDSQPVGAILTPRSDVYTIDLDDSEEELRRAIAASPYARIIVCRGGLDRIVGVLQTADLLKRHVSGGAVGRADIEAVLMPPLYVPESVTTTRLLENFRVAGQEFALIVDEYGELQGVVSVTDVLTSIVGEIGVTGGIGEQDLVRREDGSWLVDGGVTIERLRSELELEEELPGEAERTFHTLGGFVMHVLGRVPAVADHFEANGIRFEIVDMDRNRVDRVLVVPPRDGEASGPSAAGEEDHGGGRA